jgi:predicted permease
MLLLALAGVNCPPAAESEQGFLVSSLLGGAIVLFSSIRFSLRILHKHVKLASIAVFSLAIGMAAASAGLSTFHALLVRPAVPAADRLLTIYTVTPEAPFNQVSYPDYRFFRDNNRVFSGLCALPFSISLQTIKFERRDKNGLINAVSDNYFSVLGVQPLLGRFFARGDDDKDTTSVVLSYPYWKWLGSDPTIIGKTLSMNNVPLTIIGVAPRGFAGTLLTDLPDLWHPLSAGPVIFHQSGNWRADRNDHPYSMIGRMKPGVTREQALTDLQGLSRQLAAAFPATNKDQIAAVTETNMLTPESTSDAKLLGALILGIVGLVLFAACANVANLLLALAAARRHEILVRAALGATRARLIRQLLLDSTIVSAAGGILGFALASYGLRRLMDFKPFIPGLGVLPLTLDFRPDLTVLSIMVGVVFAVGITTGLAPGLHASTPNLAAALSGEVVIGGTRKGRVRNLLVVIQVAACTVVLIGVGLCLQSLHNLGQVDLGFSAHNVAILGVDDLRVHGYTEQQGRAIYRRLRDSLSQMPGVESVSVGNTFPLAGSGAPDRVHIDGAPSQSDRGIAVPYGVVDGDYFSTFGIPVLNGRVFAATDAEKSPEVILINRTMAEKYWPDQNPIGKTAHIENGNRRVTVIGVVGDTKYSDVDEAPQPYMYFALAQHYQSSFSLLVRTKGNPSQSMGALTAFLSKLEPNVDFNTVTMSEWEKFSLYIPRVTFVCVSAFGALAFVLAAVGLYGAVFYSVSERTREMGIRVALGAEPWDLWKLVLRQTSTITAIGICLGIAGGIGASVLARSMLYRIHLVEWIVFCGVAFGMVAMTLVTAYSAARPWMRVDPMQSVRHV